MSFLSKLFGGGSSGGGPTKGNGWYLATGHNIARARLSLRCRQLALANPSFPG